MVGTVDGDKALDFILANPQVLAMAIAKALLAGTMFAGHPHDLQLLRDREVFMGGRAITGLQFSKSSG